MHYIELHTRPVEGRGAEDRVQDQARTAARRDLRLVEVLKSLEARSPLHRRLHTIVVERKAIVNS